MATNRLLVRYDPGQTNPEQLLKVIDAQGYEGKVVPGGAESPTS
jgi:hypothetical protein